MGRLLAATEQNAKPKLKKHGEVNRCSTNLKDAYPARSLVPSEFDSQPLARQEPDNAYGYLQRLRPQMELEKRRIHSIHDDAIGRQRHTAINSNTVSQMQNVDERSGQIEIDPDDYDFDAAELASPREVFFVEWAEESIRKTIPYLNELLQKLIVIIITLFGASLVATKEKLIPELWGILAAMALLISLFCAIAGVWPSRYSLPLNCAAQIEQIERAAVERKAIWIRVSLIVLCLALATAAIGFLAKPPAQ